MMDNIIRMAFSMVVVVTGLTIGKEQEMNPDQPDFLPISVWYSGGKARAPMLSQITEKSAQEWRQDLEQIKALGFNTVRTWVEWAHCEPQPGQYHFENLQLLCHLAREVGLKIIIQMYVDSAPDWVGKQFPDARFETQSGAKISSQAAPGFCTDHQQVRDAVLNFYTETAKVAVQYPNFYGWDLWSEPHIVNWAYINYVPDVQFCFCPYTLARFRTWLQAKYQTLEALNQAWYRNFADWQDVAPPRFGTILSYTDFIDWKNFIYQKLAEDLRMRYQAIRRADKTHVITSHAAVPSIFYSPYNGYGATDDFLMAQQVDYYGTSLYPKHNHPDRHWELWKFMVAVDFSRSANRNNGGFYVGELQAGKGTIGLNISNPVTAEDHRIWIWSVLARGAKAINIYAYYPMASGYESGGYGLVNLDGTVTDRAQSTGQIARLVDANKDLFLNSKPVPAEIAIVYNPLAQMVGGEQHHTTGDKHFGSLVGYYRFFSGHNIPVDFIHRHDLETGNLAPYKLIIVPYPLMFTAAAARGLANFVEQGGYAVAEARLAWNDERGFAATVIPGMGLDQVFGVRETNIKMAEVVSMQVVDTSHPAFHALTRGDALKGTYFAESVEPLATSYGRILATLEDGSAAIVGCRYGKGETLYLGSFLGLANHPVAAANNNQFLFNLLNWAKITRPCTSSHDGNVETPVEIRLLNHMNGYVLVIINHSEMPQDVTTQLTVNAGGAYRLQEITRQKVIRATSIGQKLSFSTKINKKEVQVWQIQLNARVKNRQ